jgi:large subunit ribosomal protein L31e
MPEEKILTINLRKICKKTARWKRASFASHLLKKILERNVKQKVKIEQKISKKIFEKGGKKLPNKIRLKLVKTEKGYKAELV